MEMKEKEKEKEKETEIYKAHIRPRPNQFTFRRMARVAIHHFSPPSLPPDRASLVQEILLQWQLSSWLAAFPILTFQAAGQLILDIDLFDNFHLIVPNYLFLRFLISSACIEGKHFSTNLAILGNKDMHQ
jgi:hypothetical protein